MKAERKTVIIEVEGIRVTTGPIPEYVSIIKDGKEVYYKPETMAAYLDRLIASGAPIDQIVEAAVAEGTRRGDRTKYTKGTIQAHIRYREKQKREKQKRQRYGATRSGGKTDTA